MDRRTMMRVDGITRPEKAPTKGLSRRIHSRAASMEEDLLVGLYGAVTPVAFRLQGSPAGVTEH